MPIREALFLFAIIVFACIVAILWRRKDKEVDVLGNDCQASDRVGKFVEQYKIRNRI